MQTPQRPIAAARTGHFGTPLHIPATPQLKRLGLGTGVEVMLVKRSPHTAERSPWALKRLNKRVKGVQTQMFQDRLLYEADILKQLSHPNIVGFRGLIKDKNGHQCLAMEDGRESFGDILERRFDNEEGPYPYEMLKKMAMDVAKALHYLHTEAMILHGDLKGFNVLVKDNTYKLCDFGVSVPITKNGCVDDSGMVYTGTDLWTAPEIFDDPELASTKSEMFSFGLLIYEGIALVPPHTLEEPQDTSVISVKDSDDEEDQIPDVYSEKMGTRPSLPEQLLSGDYENLIGLFYICTEADPHQRPSARDAIKYLESLEK